VGRRERLVGNGFAFRAEKEEEEALDDNFVAMRNMVESDSKRLKRNVRFSNSVCERGRKRNGLKGLRVFRLSLIFDSLVSK